jgi:uncharacterized protein (DUF305 family)
MPGWLSRVPRQGRVVLGALVAVLVLALVFTAGLLTPRLTAPGDDSPEAGFARDMSVHHAQAVQMSFLEYARAENPAVRSLAYDIGTSQQYQIGVLDTWLRDWGLSLTSSRPPMAWMPDGERVLEADGRMPGMASPAEMEHLRQATGKDADVLFCQLMLRHHLGGIHMVDGILKVSDNARVRDLATSMRNGQSAEVDALQDLLTELGASPK